MISPDLRALAVPTADLQLLPGNPRRGDVEAVKRSLEAFGQRKPIVVRRDDQVVIAGNHTLQAARALGWDEIAVVWVDDDETTSKAFALADNRTAELGDYDEAALAELIGQVGSVDPELLASTGWDEAAVKELVDRIEPPKIDDGDDNAIDVLSEPTTRLGDLWEIGPHRILCGDSSDVATLDRLFVDVTIGCLLTDPPYGMNLDTHYSGMHQDGMHKVNDYKRVIGDDQPFNAGVMLDYFARVKEQFLFGADYYRSTIPDGGSWLVWDKRYNESGMQLDKLLGASFELCWSKQSHKREILRHLWSGHHGMHGEDERSRVHPTQKPVKLLVDILERWAPAKCVVADPFGGSGATLVAAAKTGRIGMGVELDPAYVDVIVRRLERVTGLKASLVHG